MSVLVTDSVMHTGLLNLNLPDMCKYCFSVFINLVTVKLDLSGGEIKGI